MGRMEAAAPCHWPHGMDALQGGSPGHGPLGDTAAPAIFVEAQVLLRPGPQEAGVTADQVGSWGKSCALGSSSIQDGGSLGGPGLRRGWVSMGTAPPYDPGRSEAQALVNSVLMTWSRELKINTVKEYKDVHEKSHFLSNYNYYF